MERSEQHAVSESVVERSGQALSESVVERSGQALSESVLERSERAGHGVVDESAEDVLGQCEHAGAGHGLVVECEHAGAGHGLLDRLDWVMQAQGTGSRSRGGGNEATKLTRRIPHKESLDFSLGEFPITRLFLHLPLYNVVSSLRILTQVKIRTDRSIHSIFD